jgi:hypothetical protein
MSDTAQFVLIAKRILRELSALKQAVSAGFLGIQNQNELRTANTRLLGIQEGVEAINEQQQAANERPDPTPEMRSILNALQGIQAEQRTGNRSQDTYQKRNLVASWAAVIVLLAYTTATAYQACVMKGTLFEIKKQTPKLSESADAAKSAAGTASQALKDSEDSFKKTLEQMKAQTVAQQKAAIATERSNKTAIASLHVSERAYIFMSPPQVDTTQHPVAISFPLTNGGHIPSGDIEVVVHQATFESKVLMLSWNPGLSIEHTWHRFQLPPTPPGTPSVVGARLMLASKEKLDSGLQAILVAGKITYGDGFPDDPLQQWYFCTQTNYQTLVKQIGWRPCDGRMVVPFLEHLDGYPNNESPE